MAEPLAIAITGLPGVGKTRLAVDLAHALWQRDEPVYVVHTDVLKVTGRVFDASAPRGPAFAGGFEARLAWARPALYAHVDKARRDGYRLIVEGTLSVSLRDGDIHELRLEADDARRRARCAKKHPAAAACLAGADLDDYRRWLRDVSASSVVDANGGPTATLQRAMEALALS